MTFFFFFTDLAKWSKDSALGNYLQLTKLHFNMPKPSNLQLSAKTFSQRIMYYINTSFHFQAQVDLHVLTNIIP